MPPWKGPVFTGLRSSTFPNLGQQLNRIQVNGTAVLAGDEDPCIEGEDAQPAAGKRRTVGWDSDDTRSTGSVQKVS